MELSNDGRGREGKNGGGYWKEGWRERWKREGKRENTLVGWEGYMRARTEKRRRIIFATLLPIGESPVMQEERGITRRLEREESGRKASR